MRKSYPQSYRHSMTDAVFMQAAMQVCARVLKNVANTLELLRVRPGSKIIHPGLGTLDECQQVCDRQGREEFLSRNDHINRRAVCGNIEAPLRGGTMP